MSTITLKSPEFGEIAWTFPPRYAHLESRLRERVENDPSFKDMPEDVSCVASLARTSMGACAGAVLAALDDVASRDVGIAIRTLDRGTLKAVQDMRAELP